jgi:hypothetical protein
MGFIGAGIGALASVFGGIASAKAMKDAQKKIEQQREDNKSWYNQRYNEDATQRADAQSMLTKTQEALKQQNKNAAGTQAVMGGTQEAVAAQKQAGANTMSNATSQIAVAGANRKDSIESTYRAKDDNFNSQLVDMDKAKANAIQTAAGQLATSASSMPV